MGFRIMQLQYETMNEETIIKQGILLKWPMQIADIKFVQFISGLSESSHDLKVTTIHEYLVQDRGNGFKIIKIAPSSLMKVQKEEAILLIVKNAEKIKTKRGQKIAGKCSNEGVFLLKPKSRIEVTNGDKTEEFVALQFEGKMYLVKVYKD